MRVCTNAHSIYISRSRSVDENRLSPTFVRPLIDPAAAALSLVVTATIVAVADDASGPPPRRRGRAAGLPAVPPPAGEVPTRPPSPGVDPMRSALP